MQLFVKKKRLHFYIHSHAKLFKLVDWPHFVAKTTEQGRTNGEGCYRFYWYKATNAHI